MHISPDIRSAGVVDTTPLLFENQFSAPNGMAYNSYVILDEKIAVIDSVEREFADEWLRRLQAVLNGKQPDYLIVQHMEPDHSGSLTRFTQAYPNTQLVATAKAFSMMQSFFGVDYAARRLVVKEGDTLPLGRHTLSFLTAPMVHWPEVMMTYDALDKVLFTADAFGRFGLPDPMQNWTEEARRYYFGIVGKYGAQVQQVLKKIAQLEIRAICPLHGPVLTENLPDCLRLYDLWSAYQSEEDSVAVVYTSVYGNTQKAAQEMAAALKAKGKKVYLHDLVHGDASAAMADIFRCSKVIFATTTYNAGIFPPMHAFLHALAERNFQRRTVGLIENGSWAPMAAKVMRQMLEGCKELTFTENTVRITSALNDASRAQLTALAEEL